MTKPGESPIPRHSEAPEGSTPPPEVGLAIEDDETPSAWPLGAAPRAASVLGTSKAAFPAAAPSAVTRLPAVYGVGAGPTTPGLEEVGATAYEPLADDATIPLPLDALPSEFAPELVDLELPGSPAPGADEVRTFDRPTSSEEPSRQEGSPWPNATRASSPPTGLTPTHPPERSWMPPPRERPVPSPAETGSVPQPAIHSPTIDLGDLGEMGEDEVEILDTPAPLVVPPPPAVARPTPPFGRSAVPIASALRPAPPPAPQVRTNTPPRVPVTPPPAPLTATLRPREADAPAPSSPPLIPPGAAWSEALAQRPRKKRLKPWFEEVFDEDYLRTLPFMTAEQTLREVGFIRDALNPPPEGQLLDIGCGYGRHAIELGQRGLRVTGVDLSLPLLIRAADESQRRALSVNFVHADMREMAFDGQFDGAYCMLTTFGYFDEETNVKVASSICRALKPGGRFLVDTLNRDYVVADLPTRVWWEGDGCVVLEEVDFNFHTSRIAIRRSVVFQDGRQLEHDISIRAYSLHELGKLFRQAGFRVLEVSGSLATRGHFFGGTSRNIMMVCERPAS